MSVMTTSVAVSSRLARRPHSPRRCHAGKLPGRRVGVYVVLLRSFRCHPLFETVVCGATLNTQPANYTPAGHRWFTQNYRLIDVLISYNSNAVMSKRSNIVLKMYHTRANVKNIHNCARSKCGMDGPYNIMNIIIGVTYLI